jgi:hypothetical protein
MFCCCLCRLCFCYHHLLHPLPWLILCREMTLQAKNMTAYPSSPPPCPLMPYIGSRGGSGFSETGLPAPRSALPRAVCLSCSPYLCGETSRLLRPAVNFRLMVCGCDAVWAFVERPHQLARLYVIDHHLFSLVILSPGGSLILQSAYLCMASAC